MSDTEYTDVELLNVPCYLQGSFDSLCAYYAGAMMLATLFPEHSVKFGKGKSRAIARMSEDPLISQFPVDGERDDRKVLAKWFYNGATIEDVVKTLNNVVRTSNYIADDMRDKTDFSYKRMKIETKRGGTTYDGTFKFIAKNIRNGLPVILGWDTEDYGCHAVLVIFQSAVLV